MMEIKAFILYKSREFIYADLIIKDAKIKEINFNDFKSIYPEENNAQTHKVREIKEVHNPERIQNGCKYFIQYSIEGEVMNIYLDITKKEYLELRRQIFVENIIKSKEFTVGLILAILASLFAILS
jgi:hypothetical protein